jgi:Xaa-Pro aminopeptidase
VETGYVLTIKEYQQRSAQLRDFMQDTSVEILIVPGAENIYYLSGFRSTFN